MGKFIGALDQGTTSTRFIVFDHGGQIAGLDQKEHKQIFPQPGWVEHNPMDSGHPLPSLKVDGGIVENELLMQIQADILNVPVIRPRIAETTALGAAYAAGLAVGFWSSQEELRQNWSEDRSWQPTLAEKERQAGYRNWKRAVEKTFD
ncbi:MAG: hypothetical protein JRD04_09350 [Deltaproteobacteria bacterium]|nr:hypothetical protein [Deltaproteobacteria bacterium]